MLYASSSSLNTLTQTLDASSYSFVASSHAHWIASFLK